MQQHQRLAERRTPARRGVRRFGYSWRCALPAAKAPEILGTERVHLCPVHAKARLARRTGEPEAPGKAVGEPAREMPVAPILTGVRQIG